MKPIKSVILSAIALTIVACSTSDENKTVGFYLTDAPAHPTIAAVYIDVQGIRYSTNDENWTDLAITPTLVNLLDYQNGNDTLLSNIELEAGVKVQQIRLILGADNYIVLTDGTEHAIQTPGAQESGLKFNVQSEAEVHSGYKVLIDFDASRSIVKKGNGGYSLKPVIRAYITANTSSIIGTISPNDIATRIFTITPGGDTIATVSDTLQNNRFVLHGLTSGTYELKAQKLETEEIESLKTGISVVGGRDVNVGTITLP